MFQTFLTEPMYNLLVVLYNVLPIHDIGVTIILLTVIIRLILWPLTGSALRGQKAMQNLQPKINDLKKRYAGDKEGMAKALMALYKEEKVNPASSCLPVLVQIPILIALYRVLLVGLNNEDVYRLYSFVTDPGTINEYFFGVLNLAEPVIFLAVLAGIAQFFQARMMILQRPPASLHGSEATKDEEMMVAMNKSMLYVMPVMTILIGIKLPGGLAVYWLLVTLLSILQQYLVLHRPTVVSTKMVP